jgi:pimeloyl-ACP methyl ester carboxylesterase
MGIHVPVPVSNAAGNEGARWIAGMTDDDNPGSARTTTATAADGEADPLDLPPGPPVRTETVHFYSDGWRLQGVLVAPGSPSASGSAVPPAPGPALVCSHGWSGAVNFRALPLAGRLAQAGYLTLVIDHRGFGGSEGPRARCDPREQVRDMVNAATYLAQRPDVNPLALGAIGASFGGGIALAAAAADQRFRACVGIVAPGSAQRWLRGLHGEAGWAALTERLAADEIARVRTGAGQRVAMPVLMPMPPSPAADAEAELMARAYPAGYPLENGALALNFAPEDEVAKFAPRALCLITTADDSVIPASHSRTIHARAGEPKVLHVLPEGNHGGPLGPLVDTTAKLTTAFLADALGPGRTR